MIGRDPIDEAPTTPDGCESTLDLERRFLSLGKYAEDLARSVGGKLGRGKAGASTVAKLLAEASKMLARAAELALRREDDALVNAREKRLRDRDRGRTHARPPLKRKTAQKDDAE